MTTPADLNLTILATQAGTELGYGAQATAAGSIAVGTDLTESSTSGAFATATNAVQLGTGKNDTPNSVKHGTKFLASVVSGAGTPTVTATVPQHIGQIYINTAASTVYVAKAASAASDFILVGPES